MPKGKPYPFPELQAAVPLPPYPSETAIGKPDDHMTRDQRFAGRRPDVLVYETEPLVSDVTIAGPIGVDLSGLRPPAPTPTSSSS